MVGKVFLVLFCGVIGIVSANPVSLAFSARDLPSMDVFNGAPDAYIIVYYAPSSTAPYQDVGETDNISDNRNPDWREIFEIQNNGGASQMLKIDMYDADSPDPDDYMGFVEFRLSEIINDPDGVVTKDLSGGSPGGGQLIIKRQQLFKVSLTSS